MKLPNSCKVIDGIIQFEGPFNMAIGLVLDDLEDFEVLSSAQVKFKANKDFYPYLASKEDNLRERVRKHPGGIRPVAYTKAGEHQKWTLKHGLVKSHLEAKQVSGGQWQVKAGFAVSKLPFKLPTPNDTPEVLILKSAQLAWWGEHPREALWVIAEGAAKCQFMESVAGWLEGNIDTKPSKLPRWLELNRQLPHALEQSQTTESLLARALPVIEAESKELAKKVRKSYIIQSKGN